MPFNGKILVLDDEPEIVKVFVDEIGVAVKKTTNGCSDPIEALKILENDDEYFLILLDFKMPKLNGLEFAKKALKINQSLKFIIISGYLDNESIEDAKNIGVVECIQKPFNMQKLAKIVQTVFEDKMRELSIEVDLRIGFLEEMSDHFIEADELVLSLESAEDSSEIIEGLFRLFHNLKGGGAAVGLKHLSHFAHGVESKLNQIRNKEAQADREFINYLFKSADIVKVAFAKLKIDPSMENINWYTGKVSLTPASEDGEEEVATVEVKKEVKKTKAVIISQPLTINSIQKIVSDLDVNVGTSNEIVIESESIDTAGVQFLLSLKKTYTNIINMNIKNEKIKKDILTLGIQGF